MTNPTRKQIEEELRRRQDADPLGLWYKPYPPALKMHKSKARIVVVLGGNRAGKTYSVAAEALDTALERDLWMPRQEQHGLDPIAWYVMPALTQAQRAVMPKFWHLLPRDRLVDWSEKKQRATLRGHKSRMGELWFLSAEMRQIRLQGASVDQIIMDESPNEDIFEELIARIVDRRGQIIIAFSPIDPKSVWVQDKLVVPALIGERSDVEVISFPIADEEGNPLVDHLNHQDIQDMFRMYPDAAARESRIFGRFATREGLVFKQFNTEMHLISPFPIPPNWRKFWVVDPQYHRFAALLFAVDPEGTYYVTSEYFSQDEPLAHRAARMWQITLDRVEGGEVSRTLPLYVDTANPQDCAELNWHFRRTKAKLGGLRLPFEKDIHKMLLRTQNLLEGDDTRKYPEIVGYHNLYGAPRLFVFNDIISTWVWDDRKMHSSRFLWEISHLLWDKPGMRPDKKSADGADCMDCFVYGTNILARGTLSTDPLAWAEGMSDADILIRQAEMRMDKRRKLIYGGGY